MSEPGEFDTVEDMPALHVIGEPGGPGFEVDFDGRTDPGRVRPSNEDHFHIIQFGRYLRTVTSSLLAGEAAQEVGSPGHGFAVADGIGGRAGGEVASRLAISLLVEL